MYLILRWVINAAAIVAAQYLIVGIHVRGFYAALIVALVLGLLNAVIRPLLVLLTLPITVLTLGLFVFIINAVLIWFTASVVKGFEVAGFLPALWLALFLWVVSVLTNFVFEAREGGRV